MADIGEQVPLEAEVSLMKDVPHGLLRDSELVSKDNLDGLISTRPVQENHHVILDEKTAAVDVEAAAKARDAQREKRTVRGKPYEEFVKARESEQPPADVPVRGLWCDRETTYPGSPRQVVPVGRDQTGHDARSERRAHRAPRIRDRNAQGQQLNGVCYVGR